jgi:rhodanese-related sulfurtransferase
MTAIPQQCELVEVSPEMVERWLAEGDTVLVDVREDYEHATERIEDTHHHPLSKFSAEQLREVADQKRLVFHCRSGKRSAEAAAKLGDAQAFHLQGGIEGWKSSGRATIRSESAPKLDVMRQVQIVAGSLIVFGVVCGVFISSWFLSISAFVGCGLIFAGTTGWCGMAMLLSRMPWNRASPSCKSCSGS